MGTSELSKYSDKIPKLNFAEKLFGYLVIRWFIKQQFIEKIFIELPNEEIFYHCLSQLSSDINKYDLK